MLLYEDKQTGNVIPLEQARALLREDETIANPADEAEFEKRFVFVGIKAFCGEG